MTVKHARGLRSRVGWCLRALSVTGSAVALSAACSTQTAVAPGEVMVAIDADVAFPKDIDSIRLEVFQGTGGPLLFGASYEVPAQKLVPATFGIVAGSGDNHVDIRVVGMRAPRQRSC